MIDQVKADTFDERKLPRSSILIIYLADPIASDPSVHIGTPSTNPLNCSKNSCLHRNPEESRSHGRNQRSQYNRREAWSTYSCSARHFHLCLPHHFRGRIKKKIVLIPHVSFPRDEQLNA